MGCITVLDDDKQWSVDDVLATGLTHDSGDDTTATTPVAAETETVVADVDDFAAGVIVFLSSWLPVPDFAELFSGTTFDLGDTVFTGPCFPLLLLPFFPVTATTAVLLVDALLLLILLLLRGSIAEVDEDVEEEEACDVKRGAEVIAGVGVDVTTADADLAICAYDILPDVCSLEVTTGATIAGGAGGGGIR